MRIITIGLLISLASPSVAQFLSQREIHESMASALRLNADSMESQYYLHQAERFTARKQVGEAYKMVKRAIRLDANNKDAIRFAGHLQMQRNQWASALDYFQDLQRFESTSQLLFMMGYCHQMMNSLDLAADLYTQVLADQPNNLQALIGRGEVKSELGEYAGAVRDFDEVIDRDPSLATAWRGRGITHTRQGNYARGLEDLTKALELNPNDGKAWFHRGLTNERSFRLTQACSDFRRARDLGVNVSSAKLRPCK